ncbi:MAG: thermonuclease family protein [Robiginitomaculum sp.]
MKKLKHKPMLKWIIGVLASSALFLFSFWLASNAIAKATNTVSPTIEGGNKGLVKGERGMAVRIIDGDTFVLASGLRVNLAGVQIPKQAWPDKGYKAWPLSGAAKNALSDLIKGKQVTLYYQGDRRDRYGRANAQVFIGDENELWVQRALAARGYARIYHWAGQTYELGQLYAAERRAREAKLGIWNGAKTGGYYDVRSPDPNLLVQHVDSLQIVEGVIISCADIRGKIYLNFGANYKTDFTIAIAKKDRSAFEKASLDLLNLVGAHVRVRGWIELQNGPIIWLRVPARMEILN